MNDGASLQLKKFPDPVASAPGSDTIARHSKSTDKSLRDSIANQESVKIAVLIPCYNEELTVAGVVESFRSELPQSQVYVFDNNSTDRTAELARTAGATVVSESRQGKGFVVQAMFRRIDADVYVMVDGDNAFPASAVHQLIAPVLNGEADMVVGSRLHPSTSSEFRPINRLANRLVLTVL